MCASQIAPRRLDHASAECLRTMLGGLQEAILFDGTVGRIAAEALVEKISAEGFGLVDRLAGVVR